MKVDSFSLAFTAMAAPRWSYKKKLNLPSNSVLKGWTSVVLKTRER